MDRLVRQLFTVPESQLELLETWLWALGAAGSVSGSGRSEGVVEAFFPAGRTPDGSDLARLREWCPAAVWDEAERVDDRDWLATYRASARPILLGARLVVDPRERDGSGPTAELDELGGIAGDRRILRLPARSAFGVGSHPSTRLAYELLEPLELRGRRVLDVGTGTGILAFAARFAGASSVVAFDLDPDAAFLAAQNAKDNAIRIAIFAGSVAAIREAFVLFDLVIANLLPHELAPERAALAALTSSDGEWIVSGLLESERAGELATWRGLGFQEVARRGDGEWVALRLAKRS